MPADTLDLEAIEARANAATHGPWRQIITSDIDTDADIAERGATIVAEAGGLNTAGRHVWSVVGTSHTSRFGAAGDTEFIAHARTDVPALVARVRELEAALDGAAALTSAVRQAFSLYYVAPELLPERVAMAGAALQTARADYEEVEQARRALHRVMHMQMRDLNESANEIAELRATLANERGEGEAPSPGWAWEDSDNGWLLLITEDDTRCVVRGDTGWIVYVNGVHERLISEPEYPTAREAMRAADKARGAS